MSAGDIDVNLSDYNADFGGITAAEVMGRGRVPQLISHDVVALMHARVRKTGVAKRLQQWRREDAIPFSMGGRPSLISDEAALTGLLLLAKERGPLHITLLSELFQYRLHEESRVLLGLESAMTGFIGHVGEQNRWYHNTSRAFHRIRNLMDPFPINRRDNKSYTEIQEILAKHDSVLERKRKARLDEFTQLFITMTFMEQSRYVRRRSPKLDISFDQTYIDTPNPKGYSKKGLARRVADEARVVDKKTLGPGLVDPYAGWHVVSGPRTDSPDLNKDVTSPPRGSKSSDEYRWGWEINLGIRVDSEAPGQHRFPGLIVAATVSLPNVRVSEEAVSLMRGAKAIGLEPGIADADKQYWANATVARLHDPAFAEGFTPSTDYRVDRMGVQGGDHGAEYIEGGVYCPGTPTPLKNATKDLLGDVIDTATYRARIEERKSFELHVKEKPDAKGRVVLRCPAIGPSPTVTCPLREMMKTVTNKHRPGVDESDVPDFADKICAQHSVSFDTANMRRQKQAFTYGTAEWDEFHTHARNSIESTNDQIKDGGPEDIQAAHRRQVRGMGAAQILVTILLTNFNLRKIAAFHSDKIKADAKKQVLGEPVVAKVRRRDREFYNAYVDSYPAGTQRPDKVRPDASDGTGGPPQRE